MTPVRTSLLSAGSLAAVLGALSGPAEATLVTFSESSSRLALSGTNLYIGDNTVTSIAAYTYLDSTAVTGTGLVARNITASSLTGAAAESIAWATITPSSVPISAGSTKTFAVQVNPTGLSRGAISGAFTFTATQGGSSEVTNFTLRTTVVAPVASSTVSTVYLLAGSGATGTTAVTLKNVGDGNLAIGSSGNLSAATNTRTLTTGWTGSVSNTSSLADGASSSAGTLTYTAQASRATNTMTVTSAFTNGNPNQTNTANTLTTTLTGVTVAPIASTTATASGGTQYVLVGSGATVTGKLTVANIGDGSFAATKLNGSLANTLGTGFASTTAAGSFALNDGKTGSAATTLTQTLTYTAEATRSLTTRTGSAVATFTNGNADGTNKAAASAAVTVVAQSVAPVQSVTATGTTLFALPGGSATGTVTINNIGDGSFVGKTLDGSVSTTNGTGFTSKAAGAFNLNDGKTGPAATTLTQTVTYTGSTRGASSTASVIAAFTNGNSAGTNAAQSVTQTFSAKTVAPVASVAATATASTVRVGTSTTTSFVVKNTGDGNLAGADNGSTVLTNLRGTVGTSSGVFSGGGNALNLLDSGSTSASFVFAPTARGAQSTTVTTTLQNGADTSNNKGTANTVVSGTAVGPVYGASVAGVGTINNGERIYFGEFVGGLTVRDLLISNLSNDSASKALTDLSLTSISISDSNEFSFSLSGFNSITGPSSGVVSNLQNSTKIGDIQIQFNNLTSKTGQAYLTIQTDEGAALGASGAVYVYDLRWTVPEPGTIMVLGTGLLGLAISRRNRRRQNEAVSLTRKDDGAA